MSVIVSTREVADAVGKANRGETLSQSETAMVAQISRIRVQEIERNAKAKIRRELMKDPIIRDALAEMFGIESLP